VSGIEFFQRDRSVSRTDAAAEVQPLKRQPAFDETALQQLSSAEVRELVTRALERAHITPTEAAKRMGISLSLFLRQLENLDNQHVSLQRLFRLPDEFWRELLVLLADRRQLAHVERRIVLEL
jgi:DNA-binding NtrC family response regulator